jgi:peptidoglycan LD-endopeptidase CwlK
MTAVDPESLLRNVHPKLAQVIILADQAPQPFRVVYGLRSLSAEAAAVASGHSETMHSRHLAGGGLGPPSAYGGAALAVDVAAIDPEGEIDWTVADASGGRYGAIADQVLASAADLGVKVQWGGAAIGAWVDGAPSHFRDWGHYQLDPSEFP